MEMYVCWKGQIIIHHGIGNSSVPDCSKAS